MIRIPSLSTPPTANFEPLTAGAMSQILPRHASLRIGGLSILTQFWKILCTLNATNFQFIIDLTRTQCWNTYNVPFGQSTLVQFSVEFCIKISRVNNLSMMKITSALHWNGIKVTEYLINARLQDIIAGI